MYFFLSCSYKFYLQVRESDIGERMDWTTDIGRRTARISWPQGLILEYFSLHIYIFKIDGLIVQNPD